MNLWAKSLGRLAMLAVALFFFSCEDDNSLLGFKNPRPKFNVSYIEIPLESSVLLIDSIITDTYGVGDGTSSAYHNVGEYDDAILGNIRAETYLQLAPASPSKLEDLSVYDSLTFQVRSNFTSYGFNGEQEMSFNVHEITGEALDLDSTRNRYYYNSSVQYNPQPIGQARIVVHSDSLKKELTKTSGFDTLLIRGRLSDDYGMTLFNLALSDLGSKFSDRNLFVQEVKGLVVTPTQSNGMLGFNPLTSLSKVILHYHTQDGAGVVKTLEKAFVFNNAVLNPNFTNYRANRSATELAGITQPYQSFKPGSGLRAVQNGSPAITKLDLSKFYEFADTVENLVINSAQIIIDDVQPSLETPPIRTLALKIMNNQNDQFTNVNVAADRDAITNYGIGSGFINLLPSGRHFYINADGSATQGVNNIFYDEDNEQYIGHLTLFTQSLFKNKNDADGINETRITFLGLTALNPGASTSIDRTVFNANNVKLRIYYTRPTASVNR